MTLVVLDTNLLVSALFSPAGNEAGVLNLFRERHLQVGVTGPVVREYAGVLQRQKFAFASARAVELLRLIEDRGLVVTPHRTLSISPDESDNRFLECAEAASAVFLITGNKRHFPLSHGVTRIENAATFLSWFSLQQSNPED